VSEEIERGSPAVSVPVSASAVGQVRQFVERHGCFTAGQTVVVAVSGGADSLCLLHVLCALRQDLGIRLHVGHLDHCLRGEAAAADARFVARTAVHLGLPATIEDRDVLAYQRLHRLTLEEAAREVRYCFLLEVAQRTGAAAVATGHTADDNVETLVLHWLRGAGLAGMRGIPAVRGLEGFVYGGERNGGGGEPAGGALSKLPAAPPVLLVRPLLALTRAQTEAYCQENGLAFRQDETNEDLRVARNRIRRQLLPELESFNSGIRATLLRAAQAAADDYDYISGQTASVWPGVAAPSRQPAAGLTLHRGAFRDQPPALQRGLLRRALQQLWGGWQDFGWVHLESLRLAVCQGRVGTVVDLPHGLALTVGYEDANLSPRARSGSVPAPDPVLPLLLVDTVPVRAPGTTPLPGTAWRLEVEEAPAPGALAGDRGEVWVDASVVGANLALRRPLPGDRFQPLGMAGDKKLHDLFVDEKVPREYRARTPVLAAEGRIVWVAGRWLAHWARVRPETRRAWHLRLRQDV
jgi:tRNA(Ile)-lysidine synthase